MLKQNIFGLFVEELADKLAELKIESYRAKQIVEWMYQKGVLQFSQMTNLPIALRALLAEHFIISSVELLDKQVSKDKKTTKFLLGYPDGSAIETVLMRQSYGNSVCVSTQVGCNIGCVFCASTIHGMVRNLTHGEIFAQVYYVDRMLRAEQQRVNTIVLMGAGEPLANYDAVLRFVRLCHAPYSLNLGYRNMTISTSGIIPMIDRLSLENLPITLSISLHAPNDAIRSGLMPVNDTYGVDEVVMAGKRYSEKTGRRVTYEYILIHEVNDDVKHAVQLSALLRGQMANVNLIPINPVLERGLKRPSANQIQRFKDTLEKHHIAVTVRREMGNDIQAACGQLRNQHLTVNGNDRAES